MDQNTHATVWEYVYNRMPSCTAAYYNLVSPCVELSTFFPSGQEFAAYLESQFQSPQALADAQECFDNPEQEGGPPAPVNEPWIFASCLAFRRSHPGHPKTGDVFGNYTFRMANPYVAAAVLKYLEQPLLLATEYFDDVGFWRQNLVIDPCAFRYLGDELRDDHGLARLAIEHEPKMFMFGGRSVRGGRELARLAIQRNGLMLEYCSMELRGDLEFVQLACNKNIKAAQFVSRAFLINPDMLAQWSGVSMRDLHPDALKDADILVSCMMAGDFFDPGSLSPEMLEAVESAVIAMITRTGLGDM